MINQPQRFIGRMRRTASAARADDGCFMRFKPGGTRLDTHTKGNYTNTAQLKELMTAPPMTAAQHAAIQRKRIETRRMIEEAKERRLEDTELF